MYTKKVLHIVGSMNQTKQLHKIACELPEYDHYYTQYFGSGSILKYLSENGHLDFTIMGANSSFRKYQQQYLDAHQCKYDYRGASLGNRYDLVTICSDLMVPSELTYAPVVFVQEGMTDPLTPLSKLIKKCNLPTWLAADTSLNGTSNKCDLYCVASDGYAEFFSSMGTFSDKIFVTGIPNFDNVQEFNNNDFPHKNFVLVCTSDLREVKKKDNRIEFLTRCKDIANGRKIIFKLHPNEIYDRANQEIQQVFGKDTLIYREGNTEHMIANCEELITQYSSTVYVGIGLGKKVHSYIDLDLLYARMPLQNNGASAHNIAILCKELLECGMISNHNRSIFGYKKFAGSLQYA
jgi:hypothetical protein